ncbi:MAG: GntR family transcriptional regulator [Terriglobia bacterium]
MPRTSTPERRGVSRNGASNPSLAEQAYQLILDQILRGSLPLGSVLSRRNLAEQFKMSLVPVAEALQRLQIEGLLESRARAGTRVRVPNTDEIRDRFELREALECQSARLCVERATFQDRLELKRAAENVDALFSKAIHKEHDRDYMFAVQKYHVDLHIKIAECARSEVLRSAIKNNHVLIFNWLYDTASGTRVLPPNFHQDLISVIVDGSPQKAEDVMREHVRYGLQGVQHAVEPLRTENWRLKRSL